MRFDLIITKLQLLIIQLVHKNFQYLLPVPRTVYCVMEENWANHPSTRQPTFMECKGVSWKT
jgi:hypothetical protein